VGECPDEKKEKRQVVSGVAEFKVDSHQDKELSRKMS